MFLLKLHFIERSSAGGILVRADQGQHRDSHIFIAVGVVMIVGILKGGEHAGWQNWTIGDAPFASGYRRSIPAWP